LCRDHGALSKAWRYLSSLLKLVQFLH
jgi:hypothetical protein